MDCFEYVKCDDELYFLCFRPVFSSFIQEICWYFDVTWLIFQQFTDRDLKPVPFLFFMFFFFYFKPLFAPLFIKLFYTNIYSKNERADLMKTIWLFYFHFIPTVWKRLGSWVGNFKGKYFFKNSWNISFIQSHFFLFYVCHLFSCLLMHYINLHYNKKCMANYGYPFYMFIL